MDEERRVISDDPENSETPLDLLSGWVTPNRLFFVRNHFDVPTIDLDAWSLEVTGCVDRPRSWTWQEIDQLPQRSVFATSECAGNGRSFLQPTVGGVQWGAGAIGHAEWTGIPVHHLLDACQLSEDVCEIVFEGADQGTEPDHPEPMPFARSLPVEKALDHDTLLVTRMNGERLELNHGFPLRLFVPGWYGVASVKWLTRIRVIDHQFQGYFQTKKYTVQRDTGRGRQTIVVGPMAVKSEIIRPHAGEPLGIGTNRVFGVAWAGDDLVKDVDVSTDGGNTWQRAELLGIRAPYSWCLWEYLWSVEGEGEYELMARAVSEGGDVQPIGSNPLNGGYLINFSRPVTVRVESTRISDAKPADAETMLYDMAGFAEENVRRPLDVDLEFSYGGGI